MTKGAARPQPFIKAGEDEPVFAHAWQAEAMAIADALVTGGLVPPNEWSQTLGGKLKAAEAKGVPDDMTNYYGAVLAAVEELLAVKGLSNAGEITNQAEAWRQAYLSTPHGHPVALKD